MLLPRPRGPLSTGLIRALRTDDPSAVPSPDEVATVTDPLADDDRQLSLWVGYELHYRGFDDVPAAWEWQPEAIALRRTLEDELLEALRRDVWCPPWAGTAVPEAIRQLVDDDDGPSLSRYLQRSATHAQFCHYVRERSTYQLKEADPHTWAIPRLAGRSKAALVEIQTDEYGAGSAERMHSELFRATLRGLGLDDSYGAYVDTAAATTLAVSNVMSLFGLRRDLRGMIVGHLAAYEMTSSAPCRRYAAGLRRLGADDATCAFYDAHVTADALHEQIAAHDLCGGLAESEPQLAEDIVFGAAVCLYVENRFAETLLDAWSGPQRELAEAG